MKPSCYIPRLLIATNGSSSFSVTKLQVDDTLYQRTDKFIAREDLRLKEAVIKAKPIDTFAEEKPLYFIGLIIMLKDGALLVQPCGQGKKIILVDPNDPDHFALYRRMRLLSAWITENGQPLVAFLLSRASLYQNQEPKEIKELCV